MRHGMPSTYIKKLLQNFAGKSKANSVNIVAQRFLQAFNDHGVKPAQIPRLMPQIKLKNLQSEATLLAVLTPELLDQTAKFFGISLKWFEGASETIYECQSCYQQPEIFFELFCGIHSRKWIDDIGIPFRVLTTSKNLDGSSDHHQPLVPVLVEKIAHLGDEAIYRYIIFNDGFDWGYAPGRIQLKAMARLAFSRRNTVTPLLVVKPEILEKIHEGQMVPRKFMHRGLCSEPSLEDFSLPAGSPISKEVNELPEVLKYIEEHKLESLIDSFKPTSTSPSLTDEQAITVTVTSNASKAANAKHAQRNAIKQRFIEFYQSNSNNFTSKKAAALHFFDSLDKKQEQLLFDHRDAAIRTLLDALRDFLKSKNPTA